MAEKTTDPEKPTDRHETTSQNEPTVLRNLPTGKIPSGGQNGRMANLATDDNAE